MVKIEIFTDADDRTGEIITGFSEAQLKQRMRMKALGQQIREEKEL